MESWRRAILARVPQDDPHLEVEMKKTIVLGAAALLVAAVRPADAQRRDIRCESYDGRQRICRVDTSGGVRLVRQLSDARCIRGRTWDAQRGAIWVSRGCRADFEVGYSGYGSGNDGWRRNGDWNTGRSGWSASSLCRTAVARRIGTFAGGVNTWTRRNRGNSVEIGWRAGRSDGTCHVNRNGRVSVQVDHRGSDRDRDWDRDRDRGRDRDRDRDRHGYHN